MKRGGQARAERRLAAILAADVAGYSRLMRPNEEGALAALKDPCDAILPTQRARRIVKTIGDDLLVRRPSF
jgi:class 3 adenylate cyclase